jgi:hypothetical protein
VSYWIPIPIPRWSKGGVLLATQPSISIWSPLAAGVLFGYGVLCIFISSYQYTIDTYEMYAASALTPATLACYVTDEAGTKGAKNNEWAVALSMRVYRG